MDIQGYVYNDVTLKHFVEHIWGVPPETITKLLAADWTLDETVFAQYEDVLDVKQKIWPDWGLNPGPSRHIPDAPTTELSGLYQQIN